MTEATAGFEAPIEPTEPAREQPETTSIEPSNQAATAGSLLARAREAAGLTRADVAGKLKFSVKQIESVETDNFLALGNKTFVRGLVRTYAKLLDIDSAPVLAALDSSALPPETGQVEADPKGVPFPTAAQPGNPLVRYAGLSMLVIAVVILVFYAWHGEEFLGGPGISAPAVKPPASRSVPAPAGATAAAQTAVNLTPTVVDMPPPAPAARAAVTTPTVPPVDRVVDKSGADKAAADKPADKSDKAIDKTPAKAADKAADKAPAKSAEKTVDNVPAQTATTNAARGAGRRILMSFERNSWVEVKDASGRVVFSQLNLAGTQQVVEGRAPFELVIGNAGYVNLRYRDAVVDLKPYTRSEVARLNLN